MDATKWTQGFQDMITVKPMEQMVSNSTITSSTTRTNNNVALERKTRPQEKLNCPRCNSTNTKFCYYNNYSLTQPRYFCKACRRYWTEGGSLRNVPVGGSSRKHKRSSAIPSSSLPSSSSTASTNVSSLGLTNKLPDLNPPILFSNQNHKTQKGSQDLNLFSFPVMPDGPSNFSQFLHHQVPKIENSQPHPNSSVSSLYMSSSPLSALELLRTGAASRGLNNFMHGPMLDSNTFYSSGFQIMQDYKPGNPSFCCDGLGNNNDRSATNNAVQETEVNGGRVLFPFGEMKQLSSTAQEVDHHQQKSQGNSNTVCWSGMFSTGGPSW